MLCTVPACLSFRLLKNGEGKKIGGQKDDGCRKAEIFLPPDLFAFFTFGLFAGCVTSLAFIPTFALEDLWFAFPNSVGACFRLFGGIKVQ